MLWDEELLQQAETKFAEKYKDLKLLDCEFVEHNKHLVYLLRYIDKIEYQQIFPFCITNDLTEEDIQTLVFNKLFGTPQTIENLPHPDSRYLYVFVHTYGDPFIVLYDKTNYRYYELIDCIQSVDFKHFIIQLKLTSDPYRFMYHNLDNLDKIQDYSIELKLYLIENYMKFNGFIPNELSDDYKKIKLNHYERLWNSNKLVENFDLSNKEVFKTIFMYDYTPLYELYGKQIYRKQKVQIREIYKLDKKTKIKHKLYLGYIYSTIRVFTETLEVESYKFTYDDFRDIAGTRKDITIEKAIKQLVNLEIIKVKEIKRKKYYSIVC